MKRSVYILAVLILACVYVAHPQQFNRFTQQRRNNTAIDTLNFPNLLPVKLNGKWGYINRLGQVVIEPQFDYACGFGSGKLAVISSNNRKGLISEDGNILVEPLYKKLQILNEKYFAVSGDSLWGIMKTDRSKITEEKYSNVYIFPGKMFLTRYNGLKGLVNTEGNTIVPVKFNYLVTEDSCFIKTVSKNGKGLYHISGKEIIPDQYEDVDVVKGKIFMLKKNSKWGAVSENKDTLFPIIYDNFQVNFNLIFLSHGKINSLFSPNKMIFIFTSTLNYNCNNSEFILCKGNNVMGAIDYSGKILLDTSCTEIRYQDGYFLFLKDGQWGLSTTKGKIILDPVYDVIQIADKNIFKIYRERRWGLANSKGTIIYNPTAMNIDYIDRIGKVYEGKKLIVIEVDNNGNELDRSEYENVSTISVNYRYSPLDTNRFFSMRRQNVQLNRGWHLDTVRNKWGLKDTTGNLMFPPVYKNILIDDTLHLTLVSLDVMDMSKNRFTKYGIIDHESYELIAPAMYEYIAFRDLKTKNIARAKMQNNKVIYLKMNSPDIMKGVGFTDDFKGGDYARVNFGGTMKFTKEYSKDIIDTYENFYFSLYNYYPMFIDNNETRYVTCEGGRWGFVDYKGAAIIPFEYDFVSRIINNRFIACRSDKWGVESLNKTIVNYEYDHISCLACSHDSLFKLEVNISKTGLMNGKGRLLTACIYDEIAPFSEGMARVKRNSNYGFINEFGNETIPCEYAKAGTYTEGLAPVKKKFKWGYVNELGQFVIEPIYRNAYSFHEGLAGVCLKSKYGFIDKGRTVIIPFQFNNVSEFSHGKAIVKKRNRYGVIDRKGEWVMKPKFKNITRVPGYNLFLIFRKSSKLYNTDGKLLTMRKFKSIGKFCDGLALVRNKGKYGYIDTIGKTVIPLKYYFASDFSNGLAAVRVDSLWGYLNTNGDFAIEPAYTYASPFSDGHAVVFYKGKYEIINSRGETIKIMNEKPYPFSEKMALIRSSKGTYFVDENGENIFNEKYANAMPFKNGHAFVYNESDNRDKDEFEKENSNVKYSWALINSNCLNITGYYFSSLKDLSPGFVTYKVPNYYGIADHSGKLVIPVEYEAVEFVGNHLFKVVTMNKTGYLKSNGDWLWKPSE